MRTRTYAFWLLISYIVGVLFFVIPIALFMSSSSYDGLLPIRSPDEGHYIVRMQPHLLNPFASVPDGVWFAPTAPTWLQVSLIEYVGGSLFAWTGLSALQVSWLLMVLLAPLSIPIVALLARRCGCHQMCSLCIGGTLFIIMREFARMFHPSISFPLTALTLLTMWMWWDTPRVSRSIIAGALSGMLVGVYLWSWTFVCAVWGCLFLVSIVIREERMKHLRVLPFVAVSALLTASPALWMSYSVSQLSMFAESADRMGLLLSRELESPIRSTLLLILTALTIWVLHRRRDIARFAPLIAMQTALLLVYNQQLVTRRVMSFSTHYYPYVCLVAILLIAFVLSHRKMGMRLWFLGIVACIPLVAAAHDYGFLSRSPFFVVQADDTVHLRPAIEELNAREPAVVLTDGYTGNLVGSTTAHSTLFIEYARILVIPTAEYVERYCLSEALTTGEIDFAWVAYFQEEQSRVALSHTRELYQKHWRMGQTICPDVKKHLSAMLRKYHVQYVLWNERTRPQWKLDPSLFQLQKQGEGWSLWTVK